MQENAHIHTPHRKAKKEVIVGEKGGGLHGLIIFSPNGKSVLTTAFEKPQDSCAGILLPLPFPGWFSPPAAGRQSSTRRAEPVGL